jgi:hypothetical protein
MFRNILKFFYPQLEILDVCAYTCNVEYILPLSTTQQPLKFVAQQKQHKKIVLHEVSTMQGICTQPFLFYDSNSIVP